MLENGTDATAARAAPLLVVVLPSEVLLSDAAHTAASAPAPATAQMRRFATGETPMDISSPPSYLINDQQYGRSECVSSVSRAGADPPPPTPLSDPRRRRSALS